MAAYVAAESDPENYGKLTVLTLPGNTQTPGPAQVQTLFRTTQEVSSLVTLSQQQGGSRVIFGNLLTLPVNDGLLYVEPFYIQGQSASSQYPQLNRVLVWYANKVGVGSTLEEALQKAVPVETPSTGGTGGTTGATTTPGTAGQSVPPTSVGVTTPSGVLPVDEAAAVTAMQSAVKELDEAKKSGDLGRIGTASQKLEEAVNNYLAVAADNTSKASTTPATPSGASSAGSSGSAPSSSSGG